MGHLGLAPYRKLFSARIIGGQQASGLHGYTGVTVAAELLAPGVFGIAEHRVHVAEPHRIFGSHVGAVLLVQQRLAGEGLAHIHHRGQRLVVHLYRIQGILGGVTAVGYYDGYRLAHMAHLVAGHGILQEPLNAGQRGQPQRDGQWLQDGFHVLVGEDAHHSGHLPCLGHVDGADVGVRVGAA